MNEIQNSRPDNYPRFENVEIANNTLFLDKGEYVVDSDGDLLQVTSGNKKYLKEQNQYLKDLNIGYIRAKYLGNKDDFLYYSNRIRLASQEEVKIVEKWLESRPGPLKISKTGQIYLF